MPLLSPRHLLFQLPSEEIQLAKPCFPGPSRSQRTATGYGPVLVQSAVAQTGSGLSYGAKNMAACTCTLKGLWVGQSSLEGDLGRLYCTGF